MTIGQRVARKRKEQGLSQEALGDRLGVSRQSIYKWESNAALPEIDKLIALSGLFGVSVGWLLGVEDAGELTETQKKGQSESAFSGTDAASTDSRELSETQLNMVQEIVDRYTAALPKSQKSVWDKWSVRILFAICGLMVGILVAISGDVKQLDSRYSSLQNNVSQVQHNVDRQIGTITNRVEEILKAQNDLTADYGTEVLRTDLAANTITFSLRAVPKTFVEGMKAEFTADSGDGADIQTASPTGETFNAEITTQLTDSITLSVVFVTPDGTRRTQRLDSYEGLYSASLAQVDVQDDLMFLELTRKEPPDPASSRANPPMLALTEDSHERIVWTQAAYPADLVGSPSVKAPAAVAVVQVGLFKNQELVAWAEPCQKPESYHGFEDCSFYRLPELEVSLHSGDTLQVAAVVTDAYGRVSICPGMPYILDDGGERLTHPTYCELDDDVRNWTFE